VNATAVPVVPTTTAVEATTYVATTSSPAATAVIPAIAVMIPAVTIAPAVMVPGASADEDATAKPLRTIVAIGCTGIGRVCIVAVRTYWRRRRRLRVTPADLDSK
jgi:hypothetical protein